jgi:hypothetical protein
LKDIIDFIKLTAAIVGVIAVWALLDWFISLDYSLAALVFFSAVFTVIVIALWKLVRK